MNIVLKSQIPATISHRWLETPNGILNIFGQMNTKKLIDFMIHFNFQSSAVSLKEISTKLIKYRISVKIKIVILTIILLSVPSVAHAEVYVQNDHGSVTWRTCKLFYVYDGYAKEEIIPTIRYIETISNFTFRKWKKSMQKQPHIEIYYLGASDTGVLGRAFIMDDYNKARINNVYISMYTKTEAVLLHEMLHAIGLAHSEDPNSIMNANYSETQVLTEQDLLNIRNTPCGSKKKK